jgi:hypothetical protein
MWVLVRIVSALLAVAGIGAGIWILTHQPPDYPFQTAPPWAGYLGVLVGLGGIAGFALVGVVRGRS